MDFKKELHTLKTEIDQEIEVYLDQVIKDTEKIDPFFASVLQYCKTTILAGGKRIRPILMYWGYVAAGGKERSKIIRTSISSEFMHAFLLMHDDIIDRDDVRRGKKTVHAKYRNYHKRFLLGDDSSHFGVSVAIIAGDFLYSIGNQVVHLSKFRPEIILKALSKLQEIIKLTCTGEVQDVRMEYSKKVKESDILAMYENKTARYTFSGPLELGAVFAGADEKFCKSLSEFAVPIGVAFQMRDDILGVFGSEQKTGKPVGSDIAEGKQTLLVSRAYKKADPVQKKSLDRLLGKKDISKKDIIKFQDILIDTGAKESVELEIQSLMEDAKKKLKSTNLPKNSYEFIDSLIDYLNNREK